jgi:protein-arginine kinase activator protein McsA
MLEEYKQLLQQSIKCQEDSHRISDSLLEVAKRIENNTKELNDKFILHTQQALEVSNNVSEIKKTLLKWIKILGVALFVSVGGATILRLLFDVKII